GIRVFHVSGVQTCALPISITIGSPRNGATINRQTVAVSGTTQAGSTLIARNEANLATATGTADASGAFSLTLPIVPGTNGITLRSEERACRGGGEGGRGGG